MALTWTDEVFGTRKVCSVCAGHLDGYLADDVKLSAAVYYDNPNPGLAKLINSQSTVTLENLIRASG